MNFEREVKVSIKGIDSLDTVNQILKIKANEFLNDGYRKNTHIEIELNKNVKKVFSEYENICSFFPPSYYSLLAGELSSKGYYSYFEFVEYLLALRDSFVRFYLKKRYGKKTDEIESFVKNDENIFKAQSRLPQSFWKGTIVASIYCLLLILSSYFVIRWRRNKKLVCESPDYRTEPGRMYFVYCKDKEIMKHHFNYYKQEPDTVCVDYVQGGDIDPGIRPDKALKYFCKLTGARQDLARDHMINLGIEDLKNAPRTPETMKKIYCAVTMAQDKNTLVFKDFMRQESREFERQFLGLLTSELDINRTIIYLGDEVYQYTSPFTTDLPVDRFREFKIDDPTTITVR